MISEKLYIIELNKGCCLETSLFRIPKGSTLELRKGVSLLGHEIVLLTDIPEIGKEFQRGKYRVISWQSRGPDFFARISLHTAGSFYYYFTLEQSDEVDGSGYVLVEPELKLGDEILALDGIQCITVLSKCLGPLSTWKDKLEVAHFTGYNMIHFTPIQELGGSNSAYSLQDQLKINPKFGDGKKSPKVDDVKKIVTTILKEWKMLSICDIVLNHSANESKWLEKHPECAYNLVNSPHLRPAYILDLALHKLTQGVAKGFFENKGIPVAVNSEDHLNAIRHVLWNEILPDIKIHELFTVDVNQLVSEFQAFCRKGASNESNKVLDEIQIIQDPLYRRLQASVDLNLAVKKYNIYRNDCFDEDTRQRKCAEAFKMKLDELNSAMEKEIESCLHSAVENCISTIRYFRIQSDGPRIPFVSVKDALVPRYFVEKGEGSEKDVYNDETAKFIMAHNGWVMNHDPLKNFAEPGSNVYLKRELISWGDSVKLRYGEKPEDCPYLWKHMKEYVEMTASIFDGIRLDNCHSTPIHVAQYLLDAARKVKPNLYVVAELFTNSDSTDNIFVNKLGITSLIREAMAAWDSHEEGRLVYRYGGRSVGGFGAWVEEGRRLVGGVAHALLLDMTHDNPSPVEKRCVIDLFPSAALVAMAACASGSTMGYDQLVPHHIHVVDEEREYMGKNEWNLGSGIAAGKLALNNLHQWLSKNRFDQVFVDQIDKDIVCVTRFNEITLESIVLFAFTAFQWPDPNSSGEGKSIVVSGNVHSVMFEAFITHRSGERFSKPQEYKKNNKIINGLDEYVLKIREEVDVDKSDMIRVENHGDKTTIFLTAAFKPGSVVAIRISAEEKAKESVHKIIVGAVSIAEAVKNVDLIDLNRALYSSGPEEPGGTYEIPGFGSFVYAGLQGIMSVLEEIAVQDDLGHPVCRNIRDGNWLAEYTVKRLLLHSGTKPLGEFLDGLLLSLKDLPASIRPCYFHCIVSQAHAALICHAPSLMSEFVKEGGQLVQMLALGSVQCGGVVESAGLPPLSPNIIPPVPPLNSKGEQACLTLAAGLPHFAVGYMRSWGRDTFISIRGLLLLTGRFNEARYLLLGYGGCLRHGLIPNLLNRGSKSRYNCRDAVWWWLYAIQEYTKLAPNGIAILKDKVNRLFPTDDSEPTSVDQQLCDVMQEALSVHFQGLCFRERNAGKEIDEHMSSFGFDNQIGVHPFTGFVFGGNEWNCGTWMDKMGSSEAAGTKGKPATPRDGSAVELVALCKATVSWLAVLHSQGTYPYFGVTRHNSKDSQTMWKWQDWANTIQVNFEKEFWVGPECPNKLANKRNIYKDSVGASQAWADFQLRPNFPIAMVVAPELFNKVHAQEALETVRKYLLGPLGMRTLDPEDWAYDGYYDNSNQSNDPKVAHGYNYHQGPEWLWPVGYYLRARIEFGGEDAKAEARLVLSRQWAALRLSPWKGLPELTNKDGVPCPGSCPTQAWSMATALEVLYDLNKFEKNGKK